MREDTLVVVVARPSEGTPRGHTAGDQGRWEGEAETRHLLPEALGRLSRLLQVTVTHPQLSAEAHYASICTDLKMISLHPYINTLPPFSPTFPKLPLGYCASQI